MKIPGKKIIILFVVLAAVLLGFFSYNYLFSEESTSRGVNTVDYGPPTEEEKSAGDKQKEEIVDREKKEEDKQNVSVAIVDAGQYNSIIEVRAFIQGVIEGGQCVATFTQNSQTVTKTTDAFIDATTTQCGTLNINRSEFPQSGIWNLVVSYASDQHTGTSEERKVTIE